MSEIVKLPIPIFYNDNAYREVEIKEPTSGVLADTSKLRDTGDYYSAYLVFIRGCITKILNSKDGITDKSLIGTVVRKMTYRAAEKLAVKILLLSEQDDEVEGVYTCPRCGEKSIAQKIIENGQEVINTIDYISNLNTVYMEESEETNSFHFELSSEIELKDKSDYVIDMDFHYPTLNDCISAYKKRGNSDQVRFQYSVFLEALEKVNGIEIDAKWKNRHGAYVFDNFKSATKDLNNLTALDSRYGLDKGVDKHCSSCGKDWRPSLSTANFFASALPSV